jgi:hypothetical protein
MWAFLSQGTGRLIDFNYTQYPDTLPWDSVNINDGANISDLSYVAYLDRTLESFVTGAGEDALNVIEGAVDVRPPSNLEAARLATLQFVAFSQSLDGNVGALQSLPFLHRCYDLFSKSESDPRFSNRDPLTLWTRQTILRAYQNSWPEFLDNILVLRKQFDTPTKMRTCFEDLEHRLRQMSFTELFEFVTSTNHTLCERFLIREVISSKLESRYEKAMLIDRDQPGTFNSGAFFVPIPGHPLRNLQPGTPQFAHVVKECVAISREALPLVRETELPLINQGWLKPEASILKLVQFGATDLASVLTQPDFLKSGALRPLVGFITLFIAQAKQPSLPNSDWWTADYLLWYAHWSLAAIVEIENSKTREPYPPELGPAIRQQILTYGYKPFLKDSKGRDFLPGLFCLAWYHTKFDLPGADSLVTQFETQARMPLDLYLSSLVRQPAQTR